MNKQTVAAILSAIGMVFILAMAFNILPTNISTFIATVCFALAGLAWAFWPKKETENKD